MYENAHIAFLAQALGELLTYFGLVAVILLQVHVAVVVAAGRPQRALAPLVQHADILPLDEGFPEL